MDEIFQFLSQEARGNRILKNIFLERMKIIQVICFSPEENMCLLHSTEFQFGTSVPDLCVNDITPLNFYRSYVSPNLPVIIREACHHWPAFRKWNKQYFW